MKVLSSAYSTSFPGFSPTYGARERERVKTCKRRQAAHLHRCETFQNLLHIALLRRTLSGILQFKI